MKAIWQKCIWKLGEINGSRTYAISTAADLGAAKKFLKLSTCDLIMTDLGLPDARGLEVLEGLREYTGKVPIVIVSGLDDEAVAQAAISQGAQDYLIKGQIDESNLVRSIRYAIIRFQTEHIARHKVATERDLLQSLLEGTPVSIARFDKNHRISTSNTAFKNNFLSASACDDFPSIKTLLPGISEEHWDAVLTKAVPFCLEGITLQRSGLAPYDVFAWAVLDRDQHINGGIFMAVDASERLNHDRHRQEFIAELAHDIKNPLIGANRVLENLLEGALGDVDEQQKIFLTEIHRSNDGLLTLLRNVLDVYRFDTSSVELAKEAVDFELIAGKAAATVIPMARSNRIALQIKVAEELPIVHGDPMAIQRLLTNLLHNAIKFSKPGGEVILMVNGNADQVVVSVSDNGTGISPRDQEYLFRRFGQGRSKYYKQGAGTGIGLYLCKKIAEAHNGSIDCMSRLGEGTTFEVKLPANVLSVCA
ncbi:hybrid sensor histidine kinase/response regulator [Candidatus Obscuribacterales bacterium]|nr:hybrid sensor histidine kinase/response regulator [Candidatus Obscuribacterales bacterium]MBX3152652.1 hybrid sensor histidine kinase/response regulator [Candidatus Obscuribacterales bacterium]